MNTRKKIFNPVFDQAIRLKAQKHSFGKECLDELQFFASVHKFDDRKTFKEAWQKWCNFNANLIENENQKMKNLGIDGDIVEKMFVSVRYYFRKKK